MATCALILRDKRFWLDVLSAVKMVMTSTYKHDKSGYPKFYQNEQKQPATHCFLFEYIALF